MPRIDLPKLSGKFVLVLDSSWGKSFSITETKCPVLQLLLLAFCPVTGRYCQEPSSWVFLHIGKTPLSLLFSRLSSPSFYPLFFCQILQSLPHCWLFSFVFQDSHVFFCRAAFQPLTPLCMRLFLHKYRTLHFLLNFMRLLLVFICSLVRSLCMAAQPSDLSLIPPSFVSSAVSITKLSSIPEHSREDKTLY